VVKAFDTPLHVVHFDAHTIMRRSSRSALPPISTPFGTFSPMKHVLSLTQVGIRSLRETEEMVGGSETRRQSRRDDAGISPTDAQGLGRSGSRPTRLLRQYRCDVLDISLVPGCVSAEPNGMSYAELRDALQAIAERADVIGFDFVRGKSPA